ncbi:MAG: hypothetical protein AAFR61_11995 [Bacteroidota bacterium]
MLPFLAHGQDAPTRFLDQQQMAAETWVQARHGSMEQILQGREHYAQYPKVLGHPFWPAEDWLIGRLETPLYTFPEILLKYDAYQDILVFGSDSMRVDMSALDPSRVGRFAMLTHQFLYLGKNSEEQAALAGAKLEPGYFELLYDGRVRLLVKRKKILRKENDDPDRRGEFVARSQYWLWNKQGLRRVESRGDTLKALTDQRQAIKAYWRQQSLTMKRLQQGGWTELLTYYDSL